MHLEHGSGAAEPLATQYDQNGDQPCFVHRNEKSGQPVRIVKKKKGCLVCVGRERIPVRLDHLEAAVSAEDDTRVFGAETDLGGAGVHANGPGGREILQSIRCVAAASNCSLPFIAERLLVQIFSWLCRDTWHG